MMNMRWVVPDMLGSSDPATLFALAAAGATSSRAARRRGDFIVQGLNMEGSTRLPQRNLAIKIVFDEKHRKGCRLA
jgi:hypothetical protein